MQPIHQARLQVHCCVLLWGFSAILGKLISLPALPLVWWRMLMVSVILLALPRVWRGVRELPWHRRLSYAGVGALVALHWLTFYASIKLTNASVGALSIALGPTFLAVVEPGIAGRRFAPRELLLAAAVIPGVLLVVGGTPHGMLPGLAIGVLSALFLALFGAFNKRLAGHADPLTATWLELASGTAVLSVLAPLLPHHGAAFAWPSQHDFVLLLLLAVGCTLAPFAMFLLALRHISAFGSQMVTSLEPVYAIVLAIVLLHEQRQLDGLFYLGVALIVGAVIVYPLLQDRRITRKLPAEP